MPLYLLHIRGIFPSTWVLEMSPASGSAGPPVLAPCRLFADRAVPNGLGLSELCLAVGSLPGENLQSQTLSQASNTRLGKTARATNLACPHLFAQTKGVDPVLEPPWHKAREQRFALAKWRRPQRDPGPSPYLDEVASIPTDHGTNIPPRRKGSESCQTRGRHFALAK